MKEQVNPQFIFNTKKEQPVAESPIIRKNYIPEEGKTDYPKTPEYNPQFVPGKKLRINEIPARIRETAENYCKSQSPEEVTELEKGELSNNPAVLAASLLEFFSSRPGEIRRTGSTYRKPEYDLHLMTLMAESIKKGEPISIFGLSFSPKFQNPDISAGQLLPDMANYLALSNLQQIAKAANKIYSPGLKITIGYEGNLYRALGRYKNESQETFKILQQLNQQAFEEVSDESQGQKNNPVEIVDAAELVKECLMNVEDDNQESWQKRLDDRKNEVREQYIASYQEVGDYVLNDRHHFADLDLPIEVEKKDVIKSLRESNKLFQTLTQIIKAVDHEQEEHIENDNLDEETSLKLNNLRKSVNILGDIEGWMNFYRGTLSPNMFKNEVAKEAYIERMAFYYKAFNEIKYQGGKNGHGILDFNQQALSITVNGTSKKINFQLVPGWDYFPHHRLTARVIKKDKKGQECYQWAPLSYKQMRNNDSVFIPRFMDGYDYPFYYDQLESAPDGDLSERASMGASVKIMQSENGEKFVVKHAKFGKQSEHLLRQIQRMQQMHEAGVSIVPMIVDSNVKDQEVYYVTPFDKGGSLDDQFFKGANKEEKIQQFFPSIIKQLSQELWEKGTMHNEERYFSDHHLPAIERGLTSTEKIEQEKLREFSRYETININGQKRLNLATALQLLKNSTSLLDSRFADSNVSEFTHGDLHFGNILMDEDGHIKLIDINGNPERNASSIEFELSRLVLSFYRQIIRDNEFRVALDEYGNSTLEFTDRGKELLDMRERVLSLIKDDSTLNKYLPDKEESMAKIKLLEAIDIATVFEKRPPEQQEATYLIGTELLHNTLEQEGGIDIAAFEHMGNKLTVENYRDPAIYNELENIYRSLLSKRWSGYSISHMFNQFVVSAIKKNGEAESVLVGLPEFADMIAGKATGIRHNSGYPVITKDFENLLQVWQALNFPENKRDKLFFDFANQERAIWNAMFADKPIAVAGVNYHFTKLLGLGKESKVFEAVNEQGQKVAIKIGLQYLNEEFNYVDTLEQKAGDLAWRFPHCHAYDKEKNMLAMELVDGEQAEDIVAGLKEPSDWANFLKEISAVVEDISSLHNDGVIAGQFNLRNVMVQEDGTYRIIDPLYEGALDVYEAKQMMRILGVLVEKIYKTNPGIFPLQVKSANSSEALRSLPYPADELAAIQNKNVGIPEPIHSEFVRICRKYLTDGLKSKSLQDLASDFSGLKYLCEQYFNDNLNENKNHFAEKPKAIILDLNGTLENGGYINHHTATSLQQLKKRGTVVAIASGKAYESIASILERSALNAADIDICADSGAAYYQNGELIQEFAIKDVAEKTTELKNFLSQQRISADIHNNSRRINITFFALGGQGIKKTVKGSQKEINVLSNWASSLGLAIISTNNGEQLDFVLNGINKSTSLQFMEAINQIKDDQIIKIGNEPNENDQELLLCKDGNLRPGAFSVKSTAETTQIIKRVMDEIGYGAKYESGSITANFGIIDDYIKSKSDDRQELDLVAQKNSNVFYPYFALKNRIEKHDKKTVDYKWILRGKDNEPIGLSAIYTLLDYPGYYNVGGMFLIPEAQGRGVATELMDKIFDFAQANIPDFKGLRVRVSEVNIPSRKLVEKTGFVASNILEDDYTLVVEGKEVKTNTIVYERAVEKAQTLIDLANDARLKPMSEVRAIYEDYKNKKAEA